MDGAAPVALSLAAWVRSGRRRSGRVHAGWAAGGAAGCTFESLSLSFWLSRFGLHSSTLLGWLCSSPLSLRNLATVVGADAVTQLAHLQILALLAACSFGCTPFGPALTTEFFDRLHIGSYKLHSRSRGETATTADVE